MERPHDTTRGGLVGGLILVLAGVVALVAQFTNLGPGAIVGAIGLAFLVAYAVTRQYGLLVPGGILTGLGAGLIAEQLGAPGGSVVLGLGGGFVLIWLVDVLASRSHTENRWWPLIPGSVLIAVGLVSVVPNFQAYLVYVGPAVLIVIGAVLVIRALATGRGDR